MRYISKHGTTTLLTKEGKIGTDPTNGTEYLFSPQGVLIVGLPTTDSGAGNYINAADLSLDTALMKKYPTDLKGATTISIEMVGQGSLSGFDNSGAALTNLTDGYRGIFFKAPSVASGTAVTTYENVWYEVLTGLVSYGGTTYGRGEKFATADAVTATASGTRDGVTTAGTYALTLPPAIINGCEAFRAEHFKIKNMKKGDEATGYYDWVDGATPKSSLTSTDTDWFGWERV